MKTKKRKVAPARSGLKLKTTEALSIVVTVLFLEVIILGLNFYLNSASQPDLKSGLTAMSGLKMASAAPSTLDIYVIEKMTEASCRLDSDCAPVSSPPRLNCQATAKCLCGNCAVVCPGPSDLSWSEALEIFNGPDQKLLMFRAHQS